MSKWELEKDNLIKYIKVDKLSYEEIGKKYNCTGSNIKKVATRLNIELEVRRNINSNESFNKKIKQETFCLNCDVNISHKLKNKYCSKECEIEHKHKIKYEYFINNPEKFQRATFNPRSFKPQILKEQNNCCIICGCGTVHNNKNLVFVLDHIDGNASNNYRSNLRLVCPNCDSQLDTYKSKNKNSARTYRYNSSVECNG